MKKKTSFTKQTIARFIRENRGKGVRQNYNPWHHVTRADPSSFGRSSRMIHMGRKHHFLSTGELIAYLFASMHNELYDLREQFPLSTVPSIHELHAYGESYGPFFPGTLDISRSLGIKHPKLIDGSQLPWIMSTDLLITLKINDDLKFIAVSYKSSPILKKRTRELLLIEKKYWEARGIDWLLITPELYDHGFANTLRSFRPFALVENVNRDLTRLLIDKLMSCEQSYTGLIKHFSSIGYQQDAILNSFWNGFWYGYIPLEINVQFVPQRIIRLLSSEDFRSYNPIYSGRSSWI